MNEGVVKGHPVRIRFGSLSEKLWLSLAVLVTSLIAALYFFLAKASTDGWVVDAVDVFRVFAIDDAYRYFIARSAWLDPHIYSWNYALPVDVIFDGLLSTLWQGNILLMRCSHIVLSVLSLFCIYRSGRYLGVRPLLMGLSTLVIALMPIYALVTMSFLGEGWLVFGIALTTCLFLSGRFTACAVAASLLPLTKPDGFFFILPLAIYFMREKKWSGIAILIAPGFIYFLHLLYALDDISVYFRWRIELRTALNVLYSQVVYRPLGMMSTFNALWLVPGLLLLPVLEPRRLWPIAAGTFLILAWFVVDIAVGMSYYEPRYFVFMLPAVAISWGLVLEKAFSAKAMADVQAGFWAFVVIVFALVVLENLMQFDPVKAKYGRGQRWPVAGVPPLEKSFRKVSSTEFSARRALAEEIYRLADRDKTIDKVLVGYPEMLLVLDPSRLPKRTRVIYIATDSLVAFGFFGGSYFGMFPWDDQYAYYTFQNPAGFLPETALYAGTLLCNHCRPLYDDQGRQLYRLAYRESSEPLARPVYKKGFLNIF